MGIKDKLTSTMLLFTKKFNIPKKTKKNKKLVVCCMAHTRQQSTSSGLGLFK